VRRPGRTTAGGRAVFAVLGASIVALTCLGPSPLAAQSAVALPGKPGAPFTISAEAVGTPALGVPFDVRVVVQTQAELEDIEVRLSVDEGLSFSASNYTLYASSATPEQPAEWRFSVVPVAEGAHRLRLFGEALVGGVRQGRSAVATIRVGGERGEGIDAGAGGDELEDSGTQRTDGDSRGRSSEVGSSVRGADASPPATDSSATRVDADSLRGADADSRAREASDPTQPAIDTGEPA